MTTILKNIGFIGGGMMAEAIIRGIIKKGLVSPASVWVSDVSNARLDYLRDQVSCVVTQNNDQVFLNTSIVILAVKPDVVNNMLQKHASAINPGHLLISICAGITLQALEAASPPNTKIVRVMPNTPCLVTEAASAFSPGSHATDQDTNIVESIFSAVGTAHQVPEKLLNAVTGLTGSGPAYVYMFIEALADGGVLKGIPRPIAKALAAQLVYGSAKMVLENPDIHPAQLRNNVESPGGTTIAATAALENAAFRSAVIKAVATATEKAEEFGNKK